MNVVKLLLNRLALTRGVGITTRENRHLDPLAPLPPIPSRTGTGLPHLRAPKTDDDILSPLTETSYALRTYHTQARLYSNDGLFSVILMAIKTITVQSGGANPKTLKICLGYLTTPGSGAAGDLVETSRAVTTGRTVQKLTGTIQNGNALPVFWVFDQVANSITFTRGGKGTILNLSSAVSAGTPHGIIRGSHDLVTTTHTNGPLTQIEFKRQVTTTKTEIVLLSNGGFLENMETTAVKKIGNTWPNFKRLEKFSPCIKGFRCSTGIYTDETLSVQLYSASFSSPQHSSVRPRLFRFLSNSEINDANPIQVSRDAVFSGDISGTYCDPWQKAPSLSNNHHLFQQASGVVWKIGISNSYNTSTHKHNLTVDLINIYGRLFESVSDVYRTLATASLPDDSAIFSKPTGTAPADGEFWVRSLPNGTEAMYVAEHRCIAKITFSDSTGATDGTGITASITHITPLTEENSVTTTPEAFTTTNDYDYLLGPVTTKTYSSLGTTHNVFRRKINAYPTINNTWEYLTYETIYDGSKIYNGANLFAVGFSYQVKWTINSGHRYLIREPSPSVAIENGTRVATLKRGNDSTIQTTTSVTWTGVGLLSSTPDGSALTQADNNMQNETYRLIDATVTHTSNSPPEAIVYAATTYNEADNFFYQGEKIPKDSPLARISINVRMDAAYAGGAAVYVAGSDPAAGYYL